MGRVDWRITSGSWGKRELRRRSSPLGGIGLSFESLPEVLMTDAAAVLQKSVTVSPAINDLCCFLSQIHCDELSGRNHKKVARKEITCVPSHNGMHVVLDCTEVLNAVFKVLVRLA